AFLAALSSSLGACEGMVEDSAPRSRTMPGQERLEPLPAGLRALTARQFAASVRTVLDLPDSVVVPEVGLWASSIAASESSARGSVEDYARVAEQLTEQVFADPALRDRLTDGCVATLADGDPCVLSVIARVGRRAFRRRLGVDELGRWSGAAQAAGTELSDAERGLAFAIAGMLQSPSFLYRVEVPEPAGEGEPSMYGSDALATRLAFFLWDATPDDALLDAAESGDLLDPDRYDAIVDRMLADERAERGVEAFVEELLQSQMLSCDGDSCSDVLERERFLPSFEAQLVHTAVGAVNEGGFRGLLTSRTAWLNAETAPFYGVDAQDLGPDLEPVALPAGSVRAGVLLTPGLLAALSSSGSPSVARRGLYVLRQFLCDTIPPPPSDVDTRLPEGIEGPVTTRDLVRMHEIPACAGCHAKIDPIGLGLERFGADGAYRSEQQGLSIDPSGTLSGRHFDDAVELSELIADDDAFMPCVTSHLVERAVGAAGGSRSAPVADVADEAQGDVRVTMRAVTRMDAFRFAWGAMP
ncbi:MAG: DUF1588 domain-containing protein, partial [Sandaracinaceae bacterium]